MPDWRNLEEYAYTRTISPQGWAWEFLRRNKEYRAARAALLEIAMAEQKATRPDLAEKKNALRSQLASFGLLSFQDPELDAAYPLGPLWSDFILIPSHDPDLNAENVTSFWLGALRFVNDPGTRDQPYRHGTWPGFPHSIELTFWFTKSLDLQIEMATPFLRYCERKVRESTDLRPETPKIRVNRDRFILYLRLLDAHASAARIGDMARVLFRKMADPRRSAKSALRAAQNIVAGRYKELLWVRSPPTEE